MGLQWLTIPVYQQTLHQRISETKVSSNTWAVKHWNSLNANYARAPHFKDSYKEAFKQFYLTTKALYLSEINEQMIKLVCSLLKIPTTISQSSNYDLKGNATERLVDLCRQSGASIYLSGPAATNYLQVDLFAQEKIDIEWMDYSAYPEYPQLFLPFEHGVSIVDLLFNTGESAPNYLKCFRK